MEIVLVEDNDADAEITIRCLRSALDRHSVVRLRDGLEASDYLFAEHAAASTDMKPLVIFLDLNMPGPDGHEILRRLKANPLTAPIPVVMLTSSGTTQDWAQSYELGVHRYLQKPVRRDSMMEIIAYAEMYWAAPPDPI